MEEVEHHKWQHYLLLAVVFTILGLMIYQVVMQEQKVDQYYMTLSLAPRDNTAVTTGLPFYPPGDSGTLNKGIQRVRDAVASTVSADSSYSMKIPHWTRWKLNIVPTIDPTDHTRTGVTYNYTFPVRSSILNDTEVLVGKIIQDISTVTELFKHESTEVTNWANDVFDTEVFTSLSYGTYGTGASVSAEQ